MLSHVAVVETLLCVVRPLVSLEKTSGHAVHAWPSARGSRDVRDTVLSHSEDAFLPCPAPRLYR